jgi:hypothetical protein
LLHVPNLKNFIMQYSLVRVHPWPHNLRSMRCRFVLLAPSMKRVAFLLNPVRVLLVSH